ncbi:DUF6253 family protein [Streptomyces sp. NPDC006326]|uniref:DUF6253 family protein n=1 Tax=Streptomyces sp. NPDC006326 TaxID=3156752 RepID=UPI0033B4338D
MSLLPPDGHVALFATAEGDTYRTPLVCWRDDGSTVYGMVLYRGSLRRAEQVPGFRRYTHEREHRPQPPIAERPRQYADSLN